MSQAQSEGRSKPGVGFWSNFRPDYFANSVYEVDVDWLSARGLRGLIVDVDNTIMVRGATVPGAELKNWVKALIQADVPLLVVSNNWSARIKAIAQELDLPVIAPAGKPLGPAFARALRELNLPADQTAIIGDQVFTDILGGNRAGLASILVPPLGEIDLAHTKILRIFEKVLLRRLAGRVLRDGRWGPT